MKKFFVVLALFAALIFAAGCGGDSGSGNSGSCPTVDGNMWSPRSSSEMDWQEALDYCDDLNECGHTDWRLPNINELRTLIQNCPGSQTGGACAVSDPDHLAGSDLSDDCYCEYKENNGGYYSKLGDDGNVWLWSSSLRSDSSILAWSVYFGNGEVSFGKNGLNVYYVRCVR